MPCSDGGAMSGAKMTPLFQDKQRPQLIIDLMSCGYPASMALGLFNLSSYATLTERGQDDMIVFLRTGSAPSERATAITLCPVDAKVATHICVDGERKKSSG